ncbi:hypothetical protein ACVWZD_005548 [Streptomyces sp. TE3672]
MQVGGLVGEDIDALVQVAIAGGLGDADVAGQAVHAAAFAEPAEHQDRLAERSKCPGAFRSPDLSPVGDQQSRKEFHRVARDVERGNISDQREASGSADDLARETCPTRGFMPVRSQGQRVWSAPVRRFRPVREDHFAERTSVTRGIRTVPYPTSPLSVYPNDAFEVHRAFIARRRALRPAEGYRTPTAEDWDQFLGALREIRHEVSAVLQCRRPFEGRRRCGQRSADRGAFKRRRPRQRLVALYAASTGGCPDRLSPGRDGSPAVCGPRW